MLAGEPEESLKGRHRSSSAVEAEHVLVQVMLQVLLAHAVVCSHKPRLEVREHSVHTGEEFGGVRGASLGHTPVVIALLHKGTVALPGVGMNHAAQGHRLLEEADQRGGGQILDDAEPDAARTLTADLNGADYDRLRAVAQATSSSSFFDTTHIGLIDLQFAAEAVTLGSDHSSS